MILSIDQAMKIAIQEAHLGAPFVSPNPKVGCVILDRDGKLLSKGYHKKYGGDHAEVEALKGLSNQELQGAHVIVTLEPCAHEGQTPSCAKKLATLPIAKVTYGLVDPNPLVAGQGAQILETAGIEVLEYEGELKAELEEVCEEFLWNFRRKEVFVALKVAQTLDGKIALKNGESQWITGPESRQKVHELRAQYDAVLVGKNTVYKDNPSLNIRHPRIQKENKIVILDREASVVTRASSLKIFELHRPENIFVVVAKGTQVESDRARIVEATDLQEALRTLYKLGLRSLMVEGGGQVFSQFLHLSCVQRMHIFTAPIVVGQGIGWNTEMSLSSMEQRLVLQNERYLVLGRDNYCTASLG